MAEELAAEHRDERIRLHACVSKRLPFEWNVSLAECTPMNLFPSRIAERRACFPRALMGGISSVPGSVRSQS
jgi:hypothetical protein